MKKITILLCLMLAGCAATPMKAPCDYQAHFCGTKIKINP